MERYWRRGFPWDAEERKSQTFQERVEERKNQPVEKKTLNAVCGGAYKVSKRQYISWFVCTDGEIAIRIGKISRVFLRNKCFLLKVESCRQFEFDAKWIVKKDDDIQSIPAIPPRSRTKQKLKRSVSKRVKKEIVEDGMNDTKPSSNDLNPSNQLVKVKEEVEDTFLVEMKPNLIETRVLRGRYCWSAGPAPNLPESSVKIFKMADGGLAVDDNMLTASYLHLCPDTCCELLLRVQTCVLSEPLYNNAKWKIVQVLNEEDYKLVQIVKSLMAGESSWDDTPLCQNVPFDSSLSDWINKFNRKRRAEKSRSRVREKLPRSKEKSSRRPFSEVNGGDGESNESNEQSDTGKMSNQQLFDALLERDAVSAPIDKRSDPIYYELAKRLGL